MAGAGLLALGACAAGPGPVAAASPPGGAIAIAVGPCFGFCPVYEATIDASGMVSFTGKRHTAVLGEQQRRAAPSVYQALERELAPFRPAKGTEAQVPCEAAISDTSTYTIRWTDAAGTVTTATHQTRCPSGPGQALDAVLGDLPKRLGIEDLAKQTTRPGTSRG